MREGGVDADVEVAAREARLGEREEDVGREVAEASGATAAWVGETAANPGHGTFSNLFEESRS